MHKVFCRFTFSLNSVNFDFSVELKKGLSKYLLITKIIYLNPFDNNSIFSSYLRTILYSKKRYPPLVFS